MRRVKPKETSTDWLNVAAQERLLRAGDVCPKAGTWQSIDIPSTIEVFNEAGSLLTSGRATA